ncbi:hypothetical protein CCP3SC15_470012 [Gammaproteobacteria bacterium]
MLVIRNAIRTKCYKRLSSIIGDAALAGFILDKYMDSIGRLCQKYNRFSGL